MPRKTGKTHPISFSRRSLHGVVRPPHRTHQTMPPRVTHMRSISLYARGARVFATKVGNVRSRQCHYTSHCTRVICHSRAHVQLSRRRARCVSLFIHLISNSFLRAREMGCVSVAAVWTTTERAHTRTPALRCDGARTHMSARARNAHAHAPCAHEECIFLVRPEQARACAPHPRYSARLYFVLDCK